MPAPFDIDQVNPEATDIINTFPANEQANRAEIEDWLDTISDPTTGMLLEAVLPPPDEPFLAGTRWVFVQTAAPTGWTKDTSASLDNRALRLVNGAVGSGGTVAFETAFASQAVAGSVVNTAAAGTIGGTALTTANLPSHTHTFTTSTSSTHTHTLPNGGSSESVGFPGGGGGPAVDDSNGATSTDGDHSHTGTTNATGSGATHTHSFTGNSHGHTFTGNAINLDVQFVDIIIATKD